MKRPAVSRTRYPNSAVGASKQSGAAFGLLQLLACLVPFYLQHAELDLLASEKMMSSCSKEWTEGCLEFLMFLLELLVVGELRLKAGDLLFQVALALLQSRNARLGRLQILLQLRLLSLQCLRHLLRLVAEQAPSVTVEQNHYSHFIQYKYFLSGYDE